jgi:hypothetical protein
MRAYLTWEVGLAFRIGLAVRVEEQEKGDGAYD